jgi:hypothetical protein
LCIAESVEILAHNLAGTVNRLSIILPWGSLLRGVVHPETPLLDDLRRLCAPDASIEIVFSCDERREAGSIRRLGLAPMDEGFVAGNLAESYERARFAIASVERIAQPELRLYETTWATRLAHGRPREIWRLRLMAADKPG